MEIQKVSHASFLSPSLEPNTLLAPVKAVVMENSGVEPPATMTQIKNGDFALIGVSDNHLLQTLQKFESETLANMSFLSQDTVCFWWLLMSLDMHLGWTTPTSKTL